MWSWSTLITFKILAFAGLAIGNGIWLLLYSNVVVLLKPKDGDIEVKGG